MLRQLMGISADADETATPTREPHKVAIHRGAAPESGRPAPTSLPAGPNRAASSRPQANLVATIESGLRE
jgi:hypothetical protein